MPEVWRRIRAADRKARAWMRARGPAILRVCLGAVFVWFGLLKVIEKSPVESLVVASLPMLPPKVAVIGIGALEVALGLGLAFGVLLRAIGIVLWLHLTGTFLVFALMPHETFQNGNPFLLTLKGEFIVKNLVLIAAGIVVVGHAHRLPRELPVGHEKH